MIREKAAQVLRLGFCEQGMGVKQAGFRLEFLALTQKVCSYLDQVFAGAWRLSASVFRSAAAGAWA